MFRSLVLAASMALMLAPPLASADDCGGCEARAAAQASPNQTRIDQRGGPHRAAAIQRGAANWADLAQQGRDLSVRVSQTGDGNSTIVRQFGANNAASITQTGDANTACLIQIGRAQNAELTQTGGQSIGLIQTPRGTREVPVEACAASRLARGGVRVPGSRGRGLN